MRKLVVLTLICCVMTHASNAKDALATVKGFVTAFNEKDIDGMLKLATSDIQWMSVSGQTITSEAGDQDALKKAMSGYFASVPSARSEIHSIHQSGSFVFALEQAFWTSKEVEKSQCSMAVYELEEGKIKHVWYFPAHVCS